MATLVDYYTRDFSSGSSGTDLTLTPQDTSLSAATVSMRVHWDDRSYARYVSYFVPAEFAGYDWLLDALLGRVQDWISTCEQGVSVTSSYPVSGVHSGGGINVHAMPFTGRIFVYVDAVLEQRRAAQLLNSAESAGLHVEFRDLNYAAFRMSQEKPLAFISHDSRDKDEVVRPLASQLSKMLCPVWYDEFELKPGDSLRESIDRGLSVCPKCIVVLSPAFCGATGWTSLEFNAAMNKHVSAGGGVIVPVWHNMDRDKVAAYSASVVDLFAVSTTRGIDEVARQINLAISPPLAPST